MFYVTKSPVAPSQLAVPFVTMVNIFCTLVNTAFATNAHVAWPGGVLTATPVQCWEACFGPHVPDGQVPVSLGPCCWNNMFMVDVLL